MNKEKDRKIQLMKELLMREYGITNGVELRKAMEEATPLDISCLVSETQEEILYA